jgi:vacuolar-type H+-ATPase subunit H
VRKFVLELCASSGRSIAAKNIKLMTQPPSASAGEADAFQSLVQEELGENAFSTSTPVNDGTGGGDVFLPNEGVESDAITTLPVSTAGTVRTPFDQDEKEFPVGRSSVDGKLWKGAGGSTFAIEGDSTSGRDAVQEASRARAQRIRERDETEREARQKSREAAVQVWEKMHQAWDKTCQEKRVETKKRQDKLSEERDALYQAMLENGDNNKPAWHLVRALIESNSSGLGAGRSLGTPGGMSGPGAASAVSEEDGSYRSLRTRMKDVIYSSASEASPKSR